MLSLDTNYNFKMELPTDAKLLAEARSYTDDFIRNIIKQSYNYPVEKVQAVKLIAKERGIEIKVYSADIRNEAQKLLEKNVAIKDVKRWLTDRGLSDEEAGSVLFEVSKTADIKPKESYVEKEKEGKSQVIWYIFGGLFLLRMIIRIFSN